VQQLEKNILTAVHNLSCSVVHLFSGKQMKKRG